MPHIPNLRTINDQGKSVSNLGAPLRRDRASARDVRALPQGYLDTPNLIYSDWLKKSGGIDQPVGSVPSGTKVAVIGGGIGGMAAAYELQKCGADVTLFESGDRVGGRCYSIALGSSDIAEMGAMRFPPSEDLLYYYAAELGFKFEDNFPDPGHYETFISYKGNGMLWPAGTQPPEAFKKVHDGWVDFVTNGVRKSGQTAFVSATKLQELLRGIDKNPGNVAVVTEAFQAYLDEFGADSFYTGLKKIFGKDHKWDPPGGAVWDDEDFTKFGTLGVGSGGFGPLYTVGFNYIFRLIPNGLETDQAIFPAGIQRLCETLRSRFVARGGSVILGTPAEISSVGGDHVVLSVNGPTGKLKEKVDRVIVATSTRSMEMGQFLTGPNYPESGNLPALSPAAVEAVSRIHVVSSTKLFVRTKKFWSDSKYPRNILTDTKVPQLYTLNYGGKEGDTETGMVLVTYTWQDDSTKTLAFDDKKGLLEELKRQLALVVQSTEFADYADQIVPIEGDDDIQMISWQTEPGFFGGFTLAQPGQDTYIQQVFFDFMKAKQAGDADSGVYLATDCITFNGGWIDGALQSSLNAVSAVVLSVGGKFNEHSANSAPINVLDPSRYAY